MQFSAALDSFDNSTVFQQSVSHNVSAASVITQNATVPWYLRQIFKCDDPEQIQTLIIFAFVLNTIFVGLIAVFGIVGNTLSILVLQTDNHNKVAVFLLQSLACADNAFLLVTLAFVSIWYGLMPMIDRTGDVQDSVVYLPILANPLGSMAQTATIWMTVLLAINRYIAVCKPFHAQRLCTLRKARLQVLCVVIFSITFNIPMFFQMKIISKFDAEANITSRSLASTSIGAETTFGVVYTNALYSIFVVILPLIIVAVLNVKLVKGLRTSRRELRRTSGPDSLATPNGDNITLIMVIIILVFLFCHTPERVLQIVLLNWKETKCKIVQNYVFNIFNVLVVINSSVNFAIYFLFKKRFRRSLYGIVCTKYSLRKMSYMGSFNSSYKERNLSKSDHQCRSNGAKRMNSTQSTKSSL